jgi:hypothetical protein
LSNFNNKLKMTFSLGYRLWRLNRFKNNFYKQSPTRIPNKVDRFFFFYEDVPSFLEVDYIILAFILIKLPTTYKSFNFFFFKIN